MKLFETTDNNRISDSLFRINSTVIKRTIEKEGSVLNLSLKLENSKINYEFNHHFETTSCSQAIEKIESKTVGLKNKSLKFMETIYGKLST